VFTVLQDTFVKYKATAEDASALITDSMHVAMSGYSGAGYPKAVVEALRERKLAGDAFGISLITGANVPWVDERLGSVGLLTMRTPMVAHKSLSTLVNRGEVCYAEQQMNRMPRLLRADAFGRIDILVVEALGFDAQGNLIPTNAIGMLDLLMQAADRIIIEINRAQHERLAFLHDVYIMQEPPHTQPIPLVKSDQRIGLKGIPFDHRKIIAIVETDIPENSTQLYNATEPSEVMAQNLFNFLELEYSDCKGDLPPVQTGFGSLADSITTGFQNTNFKDIQFFCGGVGEAAMTLLERGKARSLSTGGLGMNEKVASILSTFPHLEESLVIRNGSVTNSSEIISRLALIALNTGIEIDIYGNVNSSHIAGSKVVNGIGGGANFAQNSGLSIVLIPSLSKGGAISNIVPMVSHQDINEHDVDVVITEHGVADVRGLGDVQRAEKIIETCASPEYKEALSSYLQRAINTSGGHHPQLPLQAFGWYERLKDTGTMSEETK
jgi:acyl-CoA hydrolase